MSEPEIEGLERYDRLRKVPEEIVSRARSSKYDKVIADAKERPVKLVLVDDDRATNVYVALRARIKRDTEALQVRKRGLEVYVFAQKFSSEMKAAKLRSKISP